jgi:hypothetical protein
MGKLCDCGDHVWDGVSKKLTVLVSPEDAEILTKPWSVYFLRRAGRLPYVRVRRSEYGPDGVRRTVSLGNAILPAPPGHVTDHRDGNTLDNRRPNLRHATYTQNAQNRRARERELPKGVTIRGRRYLARIRVNGKLTRLGIFPTPDAASAAYTEAAKRLFGQFARLA